MANDPQTWWVMVKVVVLLVGMVILGRYTPILLAKFSPVASKRQRHMQLLDTLYLGSERSVHLVEVDGVRLVLGATRTGINLLKQLPGSEETEVAEGQVELNGSEGDVSPTQALGSKLASCWNGRVRKGRQTCGR